MQTQASPGHQCFRISSLRPQYRLTVSVCAEGRAGFSAQGQLLPLGSGASPAVKARAEREVALLLALTGLTGIRFRPPAFHPAGSLPPWAHSLRARHSRSAAGGLWGPGVHDEPPHVLCVTSGLAWSSQVWGQGSWRWQKFSVMEPGVLQVAATQ